MASIYRGVSYRGRSVKASAISKAQHQMERGKGRRCFVIHHAPFPISSTFRHPHQLMIRCILYAYCIRPLFVILLQPVAAGGWYASPTLQATPISLCCSCGNVHCFSSCVLTLFAYSNYLASSPHPVNGVRLHCRLLRLGDVCTCGFASLQPQCAHQSSFCIVRYFHQFS
jgi:hypothetical protein